ncbi:SixA phosphatase family protein [Candidatus Phycosocius spiralis]|uniref:Phosphoglycerate mutase n=1 Tax=Candidatus Phycosocius spiralis TaxID=2815099 RepID=A0ABQ4PVX6_9PROT|nr:histidine phosphatase family protein [Candidatus Phycosocius spiralis]GIU67137.1 phosphoglycerate mutase [Candidatus Phycosocius spiralis]
MLSELVLFRHGKAVRPLEARDDFCRGLTPFGAAQASAQALRLKAAGFLPDLALVSTALRASQTWDACTTAFPKTPVEMSRALYLASPANYLRALEQCMHSSAILIAHNPGLHDLARRLMKGDRGVEAGQTKLMEHLPTSGIAWFHADTGAHSGFKLKQFWAPLPT